jgi:hypothetical protein
MKAEEPRSAPVVKYGMGASEQNRLVERHFAVMQEERLISRLHLDHALQIGPAVRGALDKIRKR